MKICRVILNLPKSKEQIFKGGDPWKNHRKTLKAIYESDTAGYKKGINNGLKQDVRVQAKFSLQLHPSQHEYEEVHPCRLNRRKTCNLQFLKQSACMNYTTCTVKINEARKMSLTMAKPSNRVEGAILIQARCIISARTSIVYSLT